MPKTLNILPTILFALLSGLLILIYFDEGTLFLATLLLSVLLIKSIKQYHLIAPLTGVWFALSIAPAFGVQVNEVVNISNGFIIQIFLSTLFFLLYYIYQPSIIGRIYKNKKGTIGVTTAALLSGASAGISSSVCWQAYLYLTGLL